MTELQEILQEYQQSTSEVITKINQLSPKPNVLPQAPLEALFYISYLLNGGSTGGNTGGGTVGGATEETLQEILSRLNLNDDRLKTSANIENFPSNPSTSALQEAANLLLGRIETAIKAQIDIAGTIWTDGTSFYVRRDSVDSSGITITFTTPSGTPASPNPATLRPLASADKDIQTAFFDVIVSGDGYSAGDLLARALVIDTNISTPSITGIWLNFTTGLILNSPPTRSDIEKADETIGVRQTGTWTVGVSNLSDIGDRLGNNNDSPLSTPTTLGTLAAVVRGMWQSISNALAKGVATTANSISVVIASNQPAVPVSLPSTQVTPNYSSVSAPGTIPAGATSIGIVNFGTTAGTLMGVTFPPGAYTSFSAPVGQTLASVAYDATGTNYLIAGVR